jgi:lambda family phage tail tape measure protein
MGKAQVGSQAQIKAFNAIGISVSELKGKNTGEVFEKIADGLKNVTDRSQRAAIEVALFGKTGAQLDSLLSGGTARLNALGQAAQQLGVVLSDEQIQNAEVTAHKLEALKTVLEANIASTVTANANSILSLAEALSTLTNQILHFFSSNPQLALAIVGGLAGSRFGVAGAVAGVAAGAYFGEKVAEKAADANMDLRFRIKKLQDARDAVNSARANPGASGRAMPGVGVDLTGPSEADALKEFKRQKALLDRATAAALAPKPGPLPGLDLPKFLAPDAPKPKKGPADRSDELLAQMDKEILQANQNILQAKQALAGSAEEHLQISVQLVALEKTIKEKAIDEEIAKARRENAEHKITDAALKEAETKAAILKAAAETEAQVKLRAIVEEQLTQHEHDLAALSQQQLKFRLDALHTADSLATTAADHRRIQLAILDAEQEQLRQQLEQNKLDLIRNHGTKEQIDLIQKQIDNLPNQRAQQAAVIDRNTQGPLEAWKQQVPHDAATINEALQSIDVKALDGLTDAIVGVIAGTESMKEAFHNLALSVLQDILQMTIKMLIFKAIQAGLGAFGGGGGFDSSVVASNSAATGVAMPGFASGGSFLIGGRGGTDGNMMQLNGIPIARVSKGERVSISNDNGMGGGMPPPVSITNYNDFRGADAASVGAIQARQDRFEAELPYRVVQAWYDARSRNVIR